MIRWLINGTLLNGLCCDLGWARSRHQEISARRRGEAGREQTVLGVSKFGIHTRWDVSSEIRALVSLQLFCP